MCGVGDRECILFGEEEGGEGVLGDMQTKGEGNNCAASRGVRREAEVRQQVPLLHRHEAIARLHGPSARIMLTDHLVGATRGHAQDAAMWEWGLGGDTIECEEA